MVQQPLYSEIMLVLTMSSSSSTAMHDWSDSETRSCLSSTSRPAPLLQRRLLKTDKIVKRLTLAKKKRKKGLERNKRKENRKRDREEKERKNRKKCEDIKSVR